MKTVKELVSEMRSNILDMTEYDKGILYVDYDEKTNELFAGDATNCGVLKEYSIEYDKDRSLDFNLEGLFDEIIEN
jgi:hypothetical protein